MARLLVVDDEASIRKLLHSVLSREGYDTVVAEDVISAKALMEKGDFDVVISDISLPGMSGVELLQVIRQKFPRVQVILLTGMPNIETASEAVRLGAFDYLSKPFDLKAILRVVGNAVKVKELGDERSRLEKENRQYQEHLEQMVAERTHALRETESRYRRLFETARDGIMILEAKSGRIIDLNPFLVELLGYSRDYFLNSALWDIPIFKGVTLSKNAFEDLQENERIACEDLPIKTRDGRHIEVEIVSNAYQAINGKAIQCNVRDVTGRNTTLNHLRNLNEMQSKFVAEASHEIRTPLTIIKESVMQVVDGLCGEINASQKEILTLCLQSIERLKVVVNDLTDISKLEAGKTLLCRDFVDMTEVLNEIRVSFLSQAQAKNLDLEVIDPHREARGYFDRSRMIQVLTNLVGNAIKFTDKGHIHLSVLDQGDQIECSVADTGVGFAEADLPKVFGRYLQFFSSHTGPDGGTGLGLSIAKGLVELHGGKIRVQSALNQGTVFTFTVPKLNETEVLKERLDALVVQAQHDHQELLTSLIRIEDRSSSLTGGADGKASDSIRDTLDNLEAGIRRKGFTPVRVNDGMLVLTETCAERVPEINALLRETVKRCVFEIDERLHTTFSYGWCLYPRDGDNAHILLDKARESLACDQRSRADKNILIVDDNPDLVKSLMSTLTGLGYPNLSAAFDGSEALEQIEGSVPALIILDMHMPKMNGYELIGRLRHNALTARIPLLIMTGYPIEQGRLDQKAGSEAIPTLVKPVGAETLGKWVRFLL